MHTRSTDHAVDVYRTTACEHYITHTIGPAIHHARISGTLAETIVTNISKDLRVNPDNYFLVATDNPDIPSFGHPLIIKDDTELKLALDLRPFSKKDTSTGTHTASNFIDYKQMIVRAEIQRFWMDEDGDQLRTISTFPATIYGRWIAGGLVGRLGLNPEDQMRITALAISFFYQQFLPVNSEMDEKDYGRMLVFISRATYINVEHLKDIVKRKERITHRLDNLVMDIVTAVDNPRIDKLSTGLLMTSLTYGWRGAQAKEIMAVALEHIPTWLALIAIASGERAMRDTPLARLIKNNDRGGASTDYRRLLGRMVFGTH